MTIHDHSHHHRGAEEQGGFWASKAFLICAAFLVLIGFLLWTEHLAHTLGYLPYLLILACPLMHIFMHGGHGGHGGHSHRNKRDREQSSEGKP